MAAFAQVTPIGTRQGASGAPVLDWPAAGPAPTASRSLAALVAGEIIPRLVLAHRTTSSVEGRGAPPELLDIAAFAPLTLEADPHPLLACVDRLLAQGVPVDALMIDLLAPVARLLGTWWEEDRCDFVEVTIGLWRLQEVVREIASRTLPEAPVPGRRALFAAFPGDQHDFGAVMVSELFRRSGWDAALLVGADMPALLAAVGAAEYDLVGLTVSCDCHSARLPSAILALRSVSRNPRLRVMIGGRVPNADPTLAARAGADGMAVDAREALLVGEALVARPVACAVAA